MSAADSVGALMPGKARIHVNDHLVLHATPSQLVCDVLVEPGSAALCQYEYEVLIENAQAALRASAWVGLLPGLPQHWRVVEERDNNLTVLWPAS